MNLNHEIDETVSYLASKLTSQGTQNGQIQAFVSGRVYEFINAHGATIQSRLEAAISNRVSISIGYCQRSFKNVLIIKFGSNAETT